MQDSGRHHVLVSASCVARSTPHVIARQARTYSSPMHIREFETRIRNVAERAREGESSDGAPLIHDSRAGKLK